MVGDILRAEREKLGLTIKDVEAETSIRALYIDGIEKNDFDSLPSEVYVRGFVKNYATFLKLDADIILQQYRSERPQNDDISQESGNAVETGKSEKMFSSGEDFKERVHKSHRTQNILIVVLVVVIGFVGSIYYFFGDDTAKKPQQVAVTDTKEKTAPKQVDAVKPQAVAKESLSDKKETTPKQNANEQQKRQLEKKSADASSVQGTEKAVIAGNVNVGAVFSERCWVQAVVDGKTVYEGTVQKGQSFNWAASERIFVVVGNAGAVEFSHNGKNLGKAGKDGEVIESTFTANGIKKQ